MPDPVLIAVAASLAGVVAAVLSALAGLPWKAPIDWRLAIGSLLSAALGFALGCAVLKVRPHWPPVEDQDRLLTLILPAAIAIELAAAARIPGWVAWLLRIGLAEAVPRALLHGTVYLDQPSGEGGLAWSPTMRWTLLPLLGGALIAAWVILVQGNRRSDSRVVPLALGLTCCAAGLTVMLSGYASGGQLGPVLGGALIGTVVGSLLLTKPVPTDAVVGFGVVGLFSLLMVGRHFGELSSLHAILLFAAPLLSLLPLARWKPSWPQWAMTATKLFIVLLPLGVVIGLAGQQFAINLGPPSAEGEDSAADYLDYGS